MFWNWLHFLWLYFTLTSINISAHIQTLITLSYLRNFRFLKYISKPNCPDEISFCIFMSLMSLKADNMSYLNIQYRSRSHFHSPAPAFLSWKLSFHNVRTKTLSFWFSLPACYTRKVEIIVEFNQLYGPNTAILWFHTPILLLVWLSSAEHVISPISLAYFLIIS